MEGWNNYMEGMGDNSATKFSLPWLQQPLQPHPLGSIPGGLAFGLGDTGQLLHTESATVLDLRNQRGANA